MPEGMELGLEQTLIYDPTNFVFPFGAHAGVVDVDAETGKVEVVRWIAVDDCGPAINPMLIDGQVHGGVAHGIGQALYEQVVYDDDGQLVTGTFVDYALPTAAEIPSFELDRTETPSPSNSLGVKGIGEAGTIAASAAVVNAVIDALRPRASRTSTCRSRRCACGRRSRRRGAAAAARAPASRAATCRRRRSAGPDRTRGRCGMIPAAFDYAAPSRSTTRSRLLAEGGEDAKLLAGGHSLLPLMKLRLAAPTLLVDLAQGRRACGRCSGERATGASVR